jgi:hypothetical protein
MGKYDHICELTGAETYPQWKRQITLALKGERLWPHCSSGTDPSNLADLASTTPVPADPKAITKAEIETTLDWLAKDAQTKAIIDRKVSSIVASQLDENLTAREQWNILAQRYSRNDLLSQYELRARIRSERLKDADDASRHLGTFEDARRRFVQIGVTYSNDEAVFDLLQGLPDIIEWQIFREIAMTKLNTPSSSSSAPKSSFDEVAKSFTEKANAIVGKRKLAGPGSEYANIAVAPISHVPTKVNSATGIKVHRNNPNGVRCANPTCTSLPRAENHDREHCYWPGGGMEDKAPAWIRNKFKPKVETVAVATITEVANSAAEHRRELSCASLVELDISHLTALLDSGTTSHIIMDRAYFVDFTPEDCPSVRTANQGELTTFGRGTCVADIVIGDVVRRVTLRNCLYAPKAVFNLISVGRMLQRGWDCVFRSPSTSHGAHCEFSYKGEYLGQVPLIGNLCQLDVRFIPPSRLSTVPTTGEISAFVEKPLTWDVWHARLGHPGGDSVKRLPLVATGIKVDKDIPLQRCEACIMAKHPRQSFPPSENSRAASMLDLIHSDICGPFPVRTPHGKLYFIIFLDDYSHLINVQLLASKDQALEAWTIIRNLWENHAGRRVKIFHSDNGGEYISAAFTKALQDAGVERQLASPYAHQQNGKAERALRTIQGCSLAMLEAAHLPKHLWGEAVLTAAYLWNRTESRSLPPGKTPYEMVNEKKPDLAHLRVFGSRCWARIPTELQTKFGSHSRHVIFMGYPEGVKGYRVRDAANGTFFTARDVVFDESLLPLMDSDDSDSDSNHSTNTVPDLTVLTPDTSSTSPPSLSPVHQPRRSGRTCALTEKGKAYHAGLTAVKTRLEAQREHHTTTEGVKTELESLGDIEPNEDVSDIVANVVMEEQAHLAIRSDKHRDPHAVGYDMKIPPATYDEAMQRPDKDEWFKAMQTELTTMKDMNVYKVAELPKGRKAIGCRWVLEFKEDNKGGSVYKARLVAQGFSQVPGVDYGATFAPVIKPASVRLLAALACQQDWEIDMFDAKRAFLWGVLKEEIYMRQPKGFEKGDWKLIVWLMLRTIYGLTQSAMEWYEQVCSIMSDLGFVRCEADHALFYYDGEDDVSTGTKLISIPCPDDVPAGDHVKCFVGWHVDDGMGVSNSKSVLAFVKVKIAERFGIKDLGPVSRYLGVEYERNRATRELWMHQRDYIVFLLGEYGLTECNPVVLPIDPKHLLGPPDTVYPDVPDLRQCYMKLIGELIYLSINTRPDVSYVVNMLAQYNANPEARHFAAAKRVLRYLSGTVDLKLHYGGDRANDTLHAYADASWANGTGRRSITGYVWFYAGGLISHVSKKTDDRRFIIHGGRIHGGNPCTSGRTLACISLRRTRHHPPGPSESLPGQYWCNCVIDCR